MNNNNSHYEDSRVWSTWLAMSTQCEPDLAAVKVKKLNEPSMFHLNGSAQILESYDEQRLQGDTTSQLPPALESVEILSTGFTSTSSVQAMLEGLCSGYYGSEDWENIPTPNISILTLNEPQPLVQTILDCNNSISSEDEEFLEVEEEEELQEEFQVPILEVPTTITSEIPPPSEEPIVTVLLDIVVANSTSQVYIS